MIRRFIQCKNTKERMELLAASDMQEWAEGELNTIMEIFGMKVPEGASKQDKWELILLSLTSKDAAEKEALGRKVFADANLLSVDCLRFHNTHDVACLSANHHGASAYTNLTTVSINSSEVYQPLSCVLNCLP